MDMNKKLLKKKEEEKMDEIEIKKEKLAKKEKPIGVEEARKLEELKKEVSKPSIIIREEEEELTEEEKKVLVILEMVSKNKNGLRVTGFQIKDFLELIFPEIDIDKVYSQLKEKNLVSQRKDSEEFWLTYKGEEIAKKCEELKRPILEKVSHLLESVLEKNELLKRMLYLSYLDEWKFKAYYLPKIKDNLTEKHQVLCTFICDEEFLQLPSVEKLVRKVRKEEPPLLEKELENLCEDSDFLRALLILKLNELKDKLGLGIDSSLYYGNYVEGLTKFMEKSKVNEIISRFLMLGIIDSENLFNLNVEKVLLRNDNLQKIKEMLSFDENELEKEIKCNWYLFVDLKRMLDGYTPSNLEKFIKMNAVLLSKDRILVRSELRKIYDKIVNYIETKLKEKIGDISNVVILLFYDRDRIKKLEGKIVIILEGDIDDEHILEKNVILKVSPKEIGMETTRKINEEYNAIGKIENLDNVKDRFNLCEWVKVEDNYYVKKAKEIIEDKKTPKISFNEFMEEIKKDPKLSFMLFIASTKYTSRSGMRYYSEDILWSDVWINMKRIFPNITEKEFSELKNKLLELAKRARVNIVLFDEKEKVYEKCKKILTEEILKRVVDLDENSKKMLFTFLKLISLEEDDYPYNFFWYVEWGSWKNKFPILYEFFFKEKYEGDLERLWRLINSVGLGIEATWIHSHGPWKGKELHRRVIYFFKEIKEEIEKILQDEIKTIKIDISLFSESIKENIIELIGLDFILSKNGFCNKEELRDFLWNISLKAWKEFESFEGIISPKDEEIIVINPLIIEEIQKFVKLRKREIIEKTSKELIEILRSSEDFGIDITFDKELSIYRGIIRTKEGEEITLIIAPWYLPRYENLFGRKTLLIVTSQPDYEQLKRIIKEKNDEIAILFLHRKDVYIYSSFEDNSIINLIIKNTSQYEYEIKEKELEFEEIEKKEETIEKVLISKTRELKAEREILDEIFPSLGTKCFSSLFDSSGKPKCVILIGKGDGKDVIESLMKKELEYWGYSTFHTKQIECIKKDEKEEIKTYVNTEFIEDPVKVIEYISNPKYRIVTITLYPELLELIEKIVERLKEVETQGLKYILFHIPVEGLPNEIKDKIEKRSSIPIYIIKLLEGESIWDAKNRLLKFFGEGITTRTLLEFESLDSWWNKFQQDLPDIRDKLREEISRDPEIDFPQLDEEDDLHYLMKAIVYKYLKLRGYEVRIEEPQTIEERKIRPDLIAYKKGKEIYVEIETGYPTKDEKEEFGEVINPEKRLKSSKKLGKYKNKDVMLVVPNEFGIIHKRRFKSWKNYFRTKHNVNLSIYVIDWSSYPCKLIRLA